MQGRSVHSQARKLIVFFYVDDIVIMWSKGYESDWNEVHDALLARYQVKDMGELRWFLGVEVIRDRATRQMWLSQESYITIMANKFHLADEGVSRSLAQSPMSDEALSASTT